jgi:hypothetical protein
MKPPVSFPATRWLISFFLNKASNLKSKLRGMSLLIYLVVAVAATIAVTKTVDSISLEYLRLLLENGDSAGLTFEDVLNRIPLILQTNTD